MAINFLVALAIGLTLQVVGFLLRPKPVKEKPPSLQDIQEPTSEAGRPIPVVFGSGTITGLNLQGSWDKDIHTREIKLAKK